MPNIKSSADLRNNYNDVAEYCHETGQPVFITKNGKGDLVVMSIESYDEINSKLALYAALKEGLNDVEANKTLTLEEFKKEMDEFMETL